MFYRLSYCALLMSAAACAGTASEDESGAWHARRISVGAGDSLHVVYRGIDRGRVLVCIPGLADTWSSYRQLADAMPDTLGLVLVDALGHGSSTKHPGSAHPARQAAALRAALDSLGVRPFAIIGHSYGGVITQYYGLRHPDLPAAVLIATLATMRGRPAAEDWSALGRSLPDTVPEEVLAGQALSFYETVPDSVVAPFIAASRQTPGHVWREVIASLVTDDPTPQLAAWSPRTLLIIPEDDKVLGMTPMQELAAALPLAESVRIGRTSHAPHWERPDTVAHLIAAFLAKVQRRP